MPSLLALDDTIRDQNYIRVVECAGRKGYLERVKKLNLDLFSTV
jgi:hypothetical protein